MRTVLMLIGMLLFAACAPPAGEHPAPADMASIGIENLSWHHVTIYEVGSGQRIRLTSLEPFGRTTVRFRVRPTHPMVLRVEPLASRTVPGIRNRGEFYQSEPTTVRPGERVELTVGLRMASSFLSVFRR
jgi:hypothetical protein